MIEIFHIFSIFTYLENGPNMQKSRKIVSRNLKKVDCRKQEKHSKTPTKRFQTLPLSKTLNSQTFLILSFSGAFCRPMSRNLGSKFYQILSYPDRWKKCVKEGEGITDIYIMKHNVSGRGVRNRLGGVLDSFSLFSGINFFQIFRHDFSRFLHIWPIFSVGENGKNAKNLDHEKPDPRSEFRA